MAEGGSVERTVDGSEICYDFNCSVCISKKSAYSEAACYCPQCNEYFCKRCLFDFGCDHDHLGRGSVVKWGQSSRRYHFDECRHHKNNTVQLYCPHDDVVCCAVCGQTDHKSCGDLKYIPLIAAGQIRETTKQATIKDLADVDFTAENLREDRRKRLVDVKKVSQAMAQAIRDEQTMIVSQLNKLTNQSLDEVNKFETELTDRYISEIKVFERVKSEVAGMRQNLINDKVDEYLMFSRVKMSHGLVNERKKLLHDIASAIANDKAQFHAHKEMKDVEETICGLHNLGSIISEAPTDANQAPTHDTVTTTTTNIIDRFKNVQVIKPYTVAQRFSFSVATDKDEYRCSIRGMCQLRNGNLVVADFGNHALKMLDETYKVVCEMPLRSCSPNDVCNTEEDEIAVAIYYPQAIQFVSVGDEMMATYKFTTGHYCTSIDYYNKHLYIASDPDKSVYVYTPAGVHLYTISTDHHDKNMFSDIHDIAINPQHELLYVADRRKTLITMDFRSSYLATFSPSEYSLGAESVCVDGNGTVFVACLGSNVYQIAADGKQTLAQMLSKHDGINTGKICFDNVNNRLLVSTHESDTITAFNLRQ